MYKLHLICRYLFRKIAPMFAILAVALCTLMVIVVISVMGGFLSLMTDSAHALEGDLTVMGGLRGFPFYEELLKDLRDQSEIEAATAMINGYGLINLGPDYTTHVQILGIHANQYDQIIKYRNSLYWTVERTKDVFPGLDLVDSALTFQPQTAWRQRPGLVMGIAVSPFNRRDSNGQYDFANSLVGKPIPVTLTAMAMSSKGLPRPVPKQMSVINEYKSGLYEVDKLRVFVDFQFLQKTLGMDRFEGLDEDDNPRIDPARANDIVVKSRPGVSLETLQQIVEMRIQRFMQKHPEIVYLDAVTWKQRHATFLGAIQKEKVMLTILFAIISLVAVAMIGVIFYMIVLEKTHDIGVLRAMGASRSGIASIFLGYGLTIGFVGSAIGLALSASVVWNINEIQDWLGSQLGVTLYFLAAGLAAAVAGVLVGFLLGAIRGQHGRWILITTPTLLVIGLVTAFFVLQQDHSLGARLNERFSFVMWDPKVYFFDRIPARLDPQEVSIIMAIAIISGIFGALVPALLASRLRPVEALRYE